MKKLDYASIAQRMNARRVELGYSFQDLAELTGMSKSTLQRYESGAIKNIPISRLKDLSAALEIDANELIGVTQSSPIIDLAPYRPTSAIAIYGQIPAGIAQLAVEEIEGYTYVDVPDPENYFALRVKGDSMINAGIYPGDLVIIRYQPCADNGQIVACRINGDESTLKRFTQQGDTVVLLPENPKYPPQIIKASDFDNGYAGIIGVAVKVQRDLL